MNAAATHPAPWRSAVTEQFPEMRSLPESWSKRDLAATFSRTLEEALRKKDSDMTRRVLTLTLKLDSFSRGDETLIYAVQDILRQTIQSSKLRERFTVALNARAFAPLAGYIEYLSSREVVAKISKVVGLRKRGA